MTQFGFIDHPLAGTPTGAVLDLSIVLAALVWLLSVVTHTIPGSIACGRSAPPSIV